MRLYLLGICCFYLGLSTTYAQECQPDPGPALFLEDFGSGPNPGPPLEPGLTDYIFGSLTPNGYTLSNRSGLNGRIWHDGEDRTAGDTDGYMMIINADDEPNTFYQQTITDLCPNTTYIFFHYLANLMVPVACIGIPEPPQVRAIVTDPTTENILLDVSTLQFLVRSNLAWRENSFRFRTGDEQTSVRIQLINNAPGGCGNDLALDDLSLHYCNVQIEQSFDLCDLPDGRITVGNNTYTEAGTYFDIIPVANSCNDTLITTILAGETRQLPLQRFSFCTGDSIELNGQIYTSSTTFTDTLPGVNLNCPRFQTYEIVAQGQDVSRQSITLCSGDSLQVGNNWYHAAGTYLDSLRTPAGCDSVILTTITIADIAVDISPNEINLLSGESVRLTINVEPSTDYTLNWQSTEGISCLDCSTPILTPTNSGTYRLLVTDTNLGCSDSTSIQVNVERCEDIFIPTAFSPNSDKVNDRLELFAQPCFIQVVNWRIFDRWGGQVYEAVAQPLVDNTYPGWDGFIQNQPATQGVYSYQLVLERNDGSYRKIQGEVVLIR